MVSKVRGNFTDFSGEITIGETPETSSVTATVQAASITTHNEGRDADLRSSNFLDIAQYPTLTLVSTAFTPKGGNEYTLTGDLTLHGVTKSVDFDVEFTGEGATFAPGVSVIGFEAKARIDRTDFGVTFAAVLETGQVVVSNTIDLLFEIEATKQA